MSTDPTTLPVDNSVPFNPTHILYIKTDNSFKGTTKILDFTPQLQSLYSSNVGLSDNFLLEAESFANATPSLPLYTIKKDNVLASKASAKNADGDKVAEWSSPLHKLGKTKFRFEDQKGLGIEMKPLAHGTRTMEFVRDSVPFYWEGTWFESEKRGLFKVVAGTKKEVAQYAETKGRVKGGVLLVDENETETLVSVLTFCACLEGKDSFSK